MKHLFSLLLSTTTAAFFTNCTAQVTLYASEDFTGQSLRMIKPAPNLQDHRFNDRASSILVVGDRWEVCEDIGFRGHCTVLRPGRYSTLAELGLEGVISSARMIGTNVQVHDDRYAPRPGTEHTPVQVTFFERNNFQGRSYKAAGQIPDLRRTGFNDRATSAVVTGERWEVCEDKRYLGPCRVLRPGHYASLAAMGLSNEISSMRALPGKTRIDDDRYAPRSMPVNMTEASR